jgi:hypothetical protein
VTQPLHLQAFNQGPDLQRHAFSWQGCMGLSKYSRPTIRGSVLLMVLWTIIYTSCDLQTLLSMQKETGANVMGMEQTRSLTRQETQAKEVRAPPASGEPEKAPDVEGYSLSEN